MKVNSDERFTDLIRCLQFDHQILAITADNTSNNDTMAAELKSLGGANTVRTRVRCFAHVWNLVVKVRVL